MLVERERLIELALLILDPASVQQLLGINHLTCLVDMDSVLRHRAK